MAILDPKTGELESLNAGHNQIYLLKNKKLIELRVGGVPFGMMGMDFPYQSEKHIIEPGDRIVFYTDGVNEAMNEDEEEFDDVIGFENYVREHATPEITAQEFIDQLMKAIADFTTGTPQSDDITAMYLVRRE
jgi:sigma-B regulation protein RsbU (phosphoserine phosphatase)